MMMMGGMGGSGGSMGMDMMGMGNMQGMGTMQGMGNMQGMPYGSMQGMSGMNHGTMPGMYDPNAMAGMNHGTGSMLGSGGFNLNSLLGSLLNLAIDIFAILLVIGLVVGAAVLIKRYLFEGELLTPKTKVACVNCGTVLSNNWNCCPKCGQSKVVTQNAPAATPQTV